jgi:hypothetical protein
MGREVGSAGGFAIIQGQKGIVFRAGLAAAQMLRKKGGHKNPGQTETDEEGDAKHIHSGYGGRQTDWI